MLAEMYPYNRSVKIKKNTEVAVRARVIKIMKSLAPKCNRGGCRNHEGRCSMDEAWESASALADEEINSPEEIA